jgi:hypothetical protein
MLPEPEHQPFFTPQLPGNMPVTLAIPVKFYRPKPSVVRWRNAVDGASMPEATVDEYRDPGCLKNEVWTHPWVFRRHRLTFRFGQRNGHVAPPTSYLVSPQQTHKLKFRRLVAAAPDPGH